MVQNSSNRHNIVAVNMVIARGLEFLIIRRAEDEKAYPNCWALPGGKLEPGETLMEVLMRESEEEVGIKLQEEKYFVNDFTFQRTDGYNVVGLVFLVKAQEPLGDVKPCPAIQEYGWMSAEQVEALPDKYCVPSLKTDIRYAATIRGSLL